MSTLFYVDTSFTTDDQQESPWFIDRLRCYDRQAKRELIEASLQPGVSVAKLALMHGINANLLRKWIGKHLGQSFAGGLVLSLIHISEPTRPY